MSKIQLCFVTRIPSFLSQLCVTYVAGNVPGLALIPGTSGVSAAHRRPEKDSSSLGVMSGVRAE